MPSTETTFPLKFESPHFGRGTKRFSAGATIVALVGRTTERIYELVSIVEDHDGSEVSPALILRHTDLPRRTVYRLLKYAHAFGYLSCRQGGGHDGRSLWYSITKKGRDWLGWYRENADPWAGTEWAAI